MNISRIDLADAVSPEKIVSTLLEAEPSISIPVPIEELCKQLDIIEIKGLATEGFEGGLITQQEKRSGVILHNKNSPYARQRFTIAHELGHFLMPLHMPNDAGKFLCSIEDMRLLSQKEEDRRKKMEVEANRFAALLLMPPPKFRVDANNDREPNLNSILELAKKYGTSKDATSRMYAEYFSEPCAIVVAHKGKILRCYKGRNFPYIEPIYGNEFPNYSLSKRFISKDSNISEIEEVDARIWINLDKQHRKPTLYEQVMAQRDGFSLTLLSLEESDEEEDYEEELIERSWQQPRFKR